MQRREIEFRSGEAVCAAWLYRPEESSAAVADFSDPPASEAEAQSPCVVMAHGFGATREARLGAYAERFAAAGYAALVFDYRNFGDSGGEPRQLLEIAAQHADWRAAIGCARGLEGVDPMRIALWGSSFSGGHVVEIAASDPALAAVISQAPHMDGIATLRVAGPADLLRLTVAGLRDQIGALAGRAPYLTPIVAAPGRLGAMTSPDAERGYADLYPPGFAWRNEVAGRIYLRLASYSPIRKAARVRAPLLVQVASNDAVTPPQPARDASRTAPRGELIEYPVGHFDVYLGETFEQVVADQIAFLGRNLTAAG